MLVVQFLFGLVLIACALAVLALGIWLACWLVLLSVRRLPLVGRRHRHARWEGTDKAARRL
jgi:hypothetical protein